MWLAVLAGYLSLGIAIVAFTPVQREVTKELKYKDRWQRQPIAFSVLVIVVGVSAILLWPMVVSSYLGNRKRQSLYDALMSIPQVHEQKRLYDAMAAVSERGVDADVLPNGTGEFGRDSSNPIPCKTVFGSTHYLSLLRTMDGQKLQYERVGAVFSDVSPLPIDHYEIRSLNGAFLDNLYFSPYQQSNSKRAPIGFTLGG